MISNSMLPDTYITFASIALFILVTRHIERLHIAIAALLVTVIPFILNAILHWVVYGEGQGILSTISPLQYIVVVIQFGVALLLFWIMAYRSNDSIVTYLTLAAIGWPTIFLFVPYLVAQVVH